MIDRSELDCGREAVCRKALREILTSGYGLLKGGGSALDAVELAVKLLEDAEVFNAGRGSVLTAAGTVEMDASIMDGRSRRAGAVAGVRNIRNPVCAARSVMEHSPHVMLIGAGAEDFAGKHGIERAGQDYFITPLRVEQLERSRAAASSARIEHEASPPLPDDGATGTVGAVARDAEGHLAAATSTGGTNNKLPGRVGDTPLIGAGVWADDSVCAVSCTGHGEAFVRSVFGHEVDALMRLAGMALGRACEHALARVQAMGGNGGCIAVDTKGGIALLFDTTGMYRAWIDESGNPHVGIFGYRHKTGHA